MTRYQWMVIGAAWLGWGFDIFDSLLVNYVTPNCVPTLLGLTIGSSAARSATLVWTGILTSELLVGWAAGGLLFGPLGDRIGRVRVLTFTMLLYAIGTAACALAPNIWWLVLFRALASIGTGGEWAVGAAMVAEVVPERKRVMAGALMYTGSPMGLLLATLINYEVAGVWMPNNPEVSWRYVFAFGLIPALVAIGARLLVREPDRWRASRQQQRRASMSELFGPEFRRVTFWGTFVAVIALTSWWSCNAFLPVVATDLARATAQLRGLDASRTFALIETWKLRSTLVFNFGGLLGTLLTVPVAQYFGRRAMFALYFAASGAAILCIFGLDLTPAVRLSLFFLLGLTVYGVFGAFSYYMPELFPTRLRTTGAGFCYNIGRVLAAFGPWLVGVAASQGLAIPTLFYVGFVPLIGLALSPWFIETRGAELQ
jgi:MFS family permease